MKCYIQNHHNKYLRAGLDKKVNSTTNQDIWESWVQLHPCRYARLLHAAAETNPGVT